MNIKINHATQKTQRQTHGPTGLCELFLLTVPIDRSLQQMSETDGALTESAMFDKWSRAFNEVAQMLNRLSSI